MVAGADPGLARKLQAPAPAADDTAMQEWEHASSATRLLLRRKQMFEMHDALEAMKKEHILEENEFRKRESGLETRDLELQESLVKYSKFLQEKDNNRMRSDKNAAKERKLTKLKDEEIVMLREKMVQLRQKFEDLSAEHKRVRRYAEFMGTVVDMPSGDYEDAEGVMGRFSQLQRLEDEVRSHTAFFLTANEEYKDKVLALEEEGTAEILDRQNETQAMRQEIEELTIKRKKLEEVIGKDAERSQKVRLDSSLMKMGAEGLYTRLQDKTTLQKMPKPESQITLIRKIGGDLSSMMEIVAEYKEAHGMTSPEPASPTEGDATPVPA